MKVCVVSTPIIPCPPPGYSGLEMLAYQQAEGLARRGHKVLLVAPKGSVPPPGAELHETTLGESEKRAYGGYWSRLPSFDAVIDNSWQKYAYLLKMEGRLNAPVLGVLHAPVDTMYKKPPPIERPCLVAISKDQAAHITELWKVNSRVVYNGVDPEFYKAPPGKARGSRYLFLGRFSTIKGPDIAVAVAQRCRIPLDLIGDDTITAEPELAKSVRAACIGPITYQGPQPREKCVEWFSSGKALLHMQLRYREPFGLAPIEAQLCGMPVIAFDNGALRETVKHGETGFIVKEQKDVEELVRSDAVRSIKPERCREWAGQFSVGNMIARWEEILKEAVEGGGW